MGRKENALLKEVFFSSTHFACPCGEGEKTDVEVQEVNQSICALVS
jgi:hypothetical protein